MNHSLIGEGSVPHEDYLDFGFFETSLSLFDSVVRNASWERKPQPDDNFKL